MQKMNKSLDCEKQAKIIKHTTEWPICSKLTTLLVNDSLKFTLNDTQIR